MSCGSNPDASRLDANDDDVALTEEIKPLIPDLDSAGIDSLLDKYEEQVGVYDKCVTYFKSGAVSMDSVTGIATGLQTHQADLNSLKPVMNVRQLQRLKKLVMNLTSVAARMSDVDSNSAPSAESSD